MDYGYDHLSDGAEETRRKLHPLLRRAEMTLVDGPDYPEWLARLIGAEERLFAFPDPGSMDHIGRVREAVGICTVLAGADPRVIPALDALLMTEGFRGHIRQECQAMEQFYGIITPHEVLHPPVDDGASVTPAPGM